MIKSFEVDHTKLKAPCIRLADVYEKNGVVVNKYDLRFATPNAEFIRNTILHSSEHLFATACKEVFQDDMIDLSPMGCKTGFYLTVFESENEEAKIKKAISISSSVVVPEPTEKNCGNYLMHNLEGAREFLKEINSKLGGIK